MYQSNSQSNRQTEIKRAIRAKVHLSSNRNSIHRLYQLWLVDYRRNWQQKTNPCQDTLQKKLNFVPPYETALFFSSLENHDSLPIRCDFEERIKILVYQAILWKTLLLFISHYVYCFHSSFCGIWWHALVESRIPAWKCRISKRLENMKKRWSSFSSSRRRLLWTK